MTLGEIIKAYRDEHRLSQRVFAELCSTEKNSVSNGYVSMVESGRNPSTGKPIIPSVDKIILFAKGMGMSPNQLIEMADDMPVFTGDGEFVELSDTESNIQNDKDKMPPARRGSWVMLSKWFGEMSDLEYNMWYNAISANHQDTTK